MSLSGFLPGCVSHPFSLPQSLLLFPRLSVWLSTPNCFSVPPALSPSVSLSLICLSVPLSILPWLSLPLSHALSLPSSRSKCCQAKTVRNPPPLSFPCSSCMLQRPASQLGQSLDGSKDGCTHLQMFNGRWAKTIYNHAEYINNFNVARTAIKPRRQFYCVADWKCGCLSPLCTEFESQCVSAWCTNLCIYVCILRVCT